MARALGLDFLKRIRNVKWTSGVYAIIVAEGSYATANPDPERNVKVVATQTSSEVTGITGAPVTATLLEPPVNAGANFAFIDAFAGKPSAPERIEVIVVPKSKDAKDNWFEKYVVPVSGERQMPTETFLWLLRTMEFSEPRQIKFHIRNEPHLLSPTTSGGSARMVQMYPTTDTAPTTTQMGYAVWAYQTDRKKTAQIFQAPPEWSVDEITKAGALGLEFGKEPPLIAVDVPLEP